MLSCLLRRYIIKAIKAAINTPRGTPRPTPIFAEVLRFDEIATAGVFEAVIVAEGGLWISEVEDRRVFAANIEDEESIEERLPDVGRLVPEGRVDGVLEVWLEAFELVAVGVFSFVPVSDVLVSVEVLAAEPESIWEATLAAASALRVPVCQSCQRP